MIKVDELSNAQLDYWVYKAQGWDEVMYLDNGDTHLFRPSAKNPLVAVDMKIIPGGALPFMTGFDTWQELLSHADFVSVKYSHNDLYMCTFSTVQKVGRGFYTRSLGETPKLAVQRAFVKSVYGEEVEELEGVLHD